MEISNFYLDNLSLRDIKKSKYSGGLTLVKDEPDKRDFKLSNSIFRLDDSEVLPAKIDWSWKMSPVKDQGELGACVGFAVTAMKEAQENIEHDREVAEGKRYRRERDRYDLSEAWVYWNSKKIDPWPNEEGTSIRCAMKVLHKIGVPCEEAYPYSDRYKGSPKSWSKLIAKWGLIDSYWRCENIDDLRTALVNGPVVIGVGVFREMLFVKQKTGNVKYPKRVNELLGGHSVCAVGFNNKQKRIKFKNSWGKEWGKKGYGYISYRYINAFMWDAWASKDLNVTRKIIQERGKDEM